VVFLNTGHGISWLAAAEASVWILGACEMKSPKPVPAVSDAQTAAAEAEILEQSKRIDFYLTEYSVEILANKMRDGEFQVPAYQRICLGA
jgi:hypothetical protein